MTRTKTNLLAAAALTLAALSCAPDVTSIQIKATMADVPDDECVVKANTSMQKGGGSVNLGYTNYYPLGLWVRNALEAQAIKAGGKDVSPASRNDFYLEKIVLEYSGRGVPSIPAQEHSISGTIQAGGDLYMAPDILTWDAAERLAAATIPFDGLLVDVSIRFKGSFAHGSSYETEPFVFPLRVFYSAPPKCDAVRQVAVSTAGSVKPPCGNYGMDGILFACACKENCGNACGAQQQCDTATCQCVCKPDCGGCGDGLVCDTASCSCKAP